IEPVAHIDVERRVYAGYPEKSDEKAVPHEERPAWAETRQRQATCDHHRATGHGPAHADPFGDIAHGDAAETASEPSERASERWYRTQPVRLRCDRLERDGCHPRRSEREGHDAQRNGSNRPRSARFDRSRDWRSLQHWVCREPGGNPKAA